jgi:hypothetical protein
MPCRTRMRRPRFRAKNLSAFTRSSTARGSSMRANSPCEMMPSRQRPSSAPRKWTRFRSSIPAGNDDRMRMFTKELVDLQRDVIFAISTPSTAALRRETQTIPIIFVLVADPVFRCALARPGATLTGFIYTEAGVADEWLLNERHFPFREDHITSSHGIPSRSVVSVVPTVPTICGVPRARPSRGRSINTAVSTSSCAK